MKERKRLVIIETILIYLMIFSIVFLFFNIYFIIKGMSRDVLNINDKNREIVRNMIETNHNIKDFDNVKKVQYFLSFNNMEFTLYYKDGTKDKIVDDRLDSLREYIEENGYNKGVRLIWIEAIIGIVCICINEKKQEISNQIDLIDKKEHY